VVTEGNAGSTNLHVSVTLSQPSTQTVTVQWFTGPAGNAPRADPATDYTAASGTVTFAPGETAKSVTITVHGDTLSEPDEWITISFNHPTNAKMGGFWGLASASLPTTTEKPGAAAAGGTRAAPAGEPMRMRP
jgi:hypothetical protein